jgi:hypothetical protein
MSNALEDQIVEGHTDFHNPHDLIWPQIEPHLGYRLLNTDEVGELHPQLEEVEAWLVTVDKWATGYWGQDRGLTYRTKMTRAELRKARGLPPEPKPRRRHNPDNVTDDQVGAGYRLLDDDEVGPEFDRNRGLGVERWHPHDKEWLNGYSGGSKSITYRTSMTRNELRQARGLQPEAEPLYPSAAPEPVRAKRLRRLEF